MRSKDKVRGQKPEQPGRLEQLRSLMRSSSLDLGLAVDEPILGSDWQGLIGGTRPKQLIDCLAASEGSGCGLVALKLCMQACRDREELVVIDSDGSFYPPTAAAWGVDAKRLLVVAPVCPRDALAATEIALRSPATGAVWASHGAISERDFRRLLLATEAGQAFGALIRSARHVSRPSFADVQLRFDPIPTVDKQAPFLVEVTQTRNRHGPIGGSATLAIDWLKGDIEPIAVEQHAVSKPKNTRCLATGLAGATRSA